MAIMMARMSARIIISSRWVMIAEPVPTMLPMAAATPVPSTMSGWVMPSRPR